MLKKTDIEPMVIEAIREIVRNEEYAQAIKKRIGVQIDTKAVDKELEGYQAKLKEVDLNKTRLEREIDSLPADAKYRERKLNGKPDDSADTYENLELLSKVTERNFSSAATSKIQTADPLSENRPFISSGKRSTELQTIRELGEKMATVDHVADAEGMFSEINSASDSFIFRLEQCFALYPDFLTNVEIEAKVIAALQKAESYIVHLKEQHRQHLLKTTNSQ